MLVHGGEREMRFWAGLFLVVSVAAVGGAGALVWAFYERETAFFALVHLPDPSVASIPAAYWCGAAIATLLLVGLVLALAAFVVGVVGNLGAFHRLSSAWKRSQNLDELVVAVPRWSRVGHVVVAWKERSPQASAAMLIEGSAAREHQVVGVAQMIAGLLVLVGLAGNFFGLSHAIAGLPSLYEAAPAASAQPTDTVTEPAWGQQLPQAAKHAAKVHDDAQRMLDSAKQILEQQVQQLKAVPQALQDAARAADSRSRAETDALAHAAQSLDETRRALAVLPDALEKAVNTGRTRTGRLGGLLGRLGL